jgi:hypothetical protein
MLLSLEAENYLKLRLRRISVWHRRCFIAFNFPAALKTLVILCIFKKQITIMKKLLIIIYLLPFTSFAQSVIRIKFPMDSLTRRVTYKQEIVVEGIKKGSYTYRGAMARSAPENYSVYFTARITVADEKFSLVQTGFRVDLNNFVTPLEGYFHGTLPGTAGNNAYAADTFAMYSYLLNDINFSATAMLKDVDKYVQKAKKKGKF